VPCFARKKFNSSTRFILHVETPGRDLYNFKLEKKSYKTRIYGLDYANFLSEYNMKHGDQLRLYMNNKPPYMFMHPLDKYGYEKERVLGMVF
jgi:hypothetical protein